MNENETPVVKQIDAEKTAMYQNFANKRLLIALISVIVGFIIYASIFVIGYTIREQHWQETMSREGGYSGHYPPMMGYYPESYGERW